MAKASAEFDVIIYGATGYTGRLVAEHFIRGQSQSNAPSWAMAGRSAQKLAEVRDLIGAPADTPLITANSDDPDSMNALAKRARIIITTVGPYQLYGESLVAACAAEGTDYTDLCGEPIWMRQMIDKYADAAKMSGARICFSCGFDSIPFDLGVLMLQKEAQSRFGAAVPRIKGRVRAMEGTFSGGTAASLKASLATLKKDPSLMPYMLSPFALTPGFEGPDQPRGDTPAFDEQLDSWTAPFIMAAINTKNVHRTNFLLGHRYGADFAYDEMILTGPGEEGAAAAKHIAITPMIGSDNDPKPGEGPSAEERENGHYDVLFIGEAANGQTIHYGVKGKYDPGYGSTSRMIAETAMGLLENDGDGGIGTPGSFLGEALARRLEENAEISFAAEN